MSSCIYAKSTSEWCILNTGQKAMRTKGHPIVRPPEQKEDCCSDFFKSDLIAYNIAEQQSWSRLVVGTTSSLYCTADASLEFQTGFRSGWRSRYCCITASTTLHPTATAWSQPQRRCGWLQAARLRPDLLPLATVPSCRWLLYLLRTQQESVRASLSLLVDWRPSF